MMNCYQLRLILVFCCRQIIYSLLGEMSSSFLFLFFQVIPQCGAVRFMDGKIFWVTVCSPNDISGLRRPKNVKFGTKVTSSARMMCALRYLESFLICGKICKKKLLRKSAKNAIFHFTHQRSAAPGCNSPQQAVLSNMTSLT